MSQEAIWFKLPPPPTAIPGPPPEPATPTIELTIDGSSVNIAQGATILDACRAAGKDIPTLCYLETLTPVNVCRVCVVEVEGSRTLVPACSRQVEAGMVVTIDPLNPGKLALSYIYFLFTSTTKSW